MKDSKGHFYKKFGAYCGKCGMGDTTLNIGPMPHRYVESVVKGYCAACGAVLVLEHGDQRAHDRTIPQALIDQRAMGYDEGQRSVPLADRELNRELRLAIQSVLESSKVGWLDDSVMNYGEYRELVGILVGVAKSYARDVVAGQNALRTGSVVPPAGPPSGYTDTGTPAPLRRTE